MRGRDVFSRETVAGLSWKHFEGQNANIVRVQNVLNAYVSNTLVSSRLVDRVTHSVETCHNFYER